MNRPNMKHLAVTLAVVMISLLAPTTVARAAGNGLTPYITDLMLIGKNNKSEAEALKAQYVKDGWTAIEQDLNAGCGSKSDYIYLLYKVGNLASANQSFITDIYITTDGTSDINATRTINRREYKLVPYDGDKHFMEKKGDLNSNAGGDDIHLYYTTDNYNDYKAISSIAFNETQSDAVGKNGDNSKGYDLNTRAGGEDIYMHCTRNYAPQWIIEKNNDGSGRCIIKGFTPRGIIKSNIKAFPSRVCGAQVVGVASSLNYKDFPNLETIYLYEKPLSSVMIPMDSCKNLQHVHTVDINGKVIKYDLLPTSITSIPKKGFWGCSALTSFTIPGSVESIGQEAFSGCSALTSITITNGVKSIGQEAFSGCSALTSITIPVSVESIGENAFKGCSKLQIIYVYPDNPNYKEIDGVLFDKAGTNILEFPPAYPNTDYVIPDGVTDIGTIFAGRTNLTGITIPGSVESIGQEAFKGCTGLTSVTIKDGVESIGYKAFSECKSLRSVNIENGVKSIGQEAFSSCPLTGITIPGSVESIGNKAFSACTSLKSVTIENGVKSIGQEAFLDCTGLESITIPGSVESIGQEAFKGCTGLTSVTIENGVKSIGQEAFFGCPLTGITIPGSVESIGQEAFKGCTGLTSVTIKDGVKSIGQKAFSGCPLTNITIPGSVESIGYKAFSECKSLGSVTIENGVKSIGQEAFKGCSGLTSITIKDGVKSIGQEAFSGCPLTNITIPGSVESIGGSAFEGCTSLGSVTIENGVKSIGGSAFYNCNAIANITIPGSVESIGGSAFEGCTSLASVAIENGVKSIGREAFYECKSLESITIPSSVKSIEMSAFWRCTSLESVSIMGNPKIGYDVFTDEATVTLNLTANAANGAKWMTFYNDRYNFQADANTTVYKATVVGQSLVLTEVADRIVDTGAAVILKSTGNPVMTRVTDRSSDTQANALIGTMEATATPANCFTLASGSKGVGFYHYTGSEVAAGKAYLIYSGTSAAREFIGFDEGGEATGISTITVPATLEGNGSAWYGLDGRKLQGDPAKKGIYVRNGQTVIIK